MAPIVTMAAPKTPHGKETTAAEVMQNIKVFVRCRPLKANEKKNVIEVLPERREVRINESKNSNERYNSKTFTFDNTFGADTNQIQVYRAVVEPLIEQVVMGYNCTVFAYGQTGTGKTYTMEGERSQEDDVCSWEDDPSAGIIPRALHQLFETLSTESTEHTVRVSFLELYNEELYDLLSPLDDTTKLKIFEDTTRKGSVIVGGLEEITVQSKEEIYEILKKGSAKRQTAATLLNACSSRSHTIFSVTVHIKENNAIDGEDLVKIGKLNLVDLAGSENIGRSGAIDKRAREAGNINQSLLTLGRVITSLVDRTPHIPYRESKLTRLLQESLGGRTKTSIIATISPNIADSDDTLSTLEYAQRAKKITNKPEINQKLSKKTLLREYTAEIERLRRDLAACREKNGIYVDVNNFNQMEQQIKEQTQEIEDKTAQIQALTEEMARVQTLFQETQEELEITSKTLKTTSKLLTETKQDLSVTRTDRDEQKHLVEVHLNSEKALSGQAKELLSVADVTTSHISKLHEKVDRQRSVETNNWSKTIDFQEKFVEDMKRLEELVSITTSSYNDTLEEMQDSIKGNITSVEGIVNNAQKKVLSLSEAVTDFKAQFSSIFTKDRINLENSLSLKDSAQQIDTTLVQALDAISKSVEETKSAINVDIEQLNQIVAQQRQDIEDVVMKQNSHMKKVSKRTINSFEAIKNELKAVFETQNEEMSALITQIEAKGHDDCEGHKATDQELSDFEQLQDEMTKLIENEMKKLIENQMNKLNQIKIQRIKARVESEQRTTQLVESIKEKTSSRMDSLDVMNTKVDTFAAEIKCEESVALKYVSNIDELNSDITQKLMNQLNQMNTKNTSLPIQTRDMIESHKQVLSQQISEAIKLNDQSIKMSDKQLSAKQTTLKAFEDTFTDNIEEQKSLVSNIGQNMEVITGCVEEKASEMIGLSKTMEKSHIREIENRSKSFKSFVKNDLMKDTPTGTTPQKTTYSYPRDLVETSPHQRILERFRLVNACNTPLPESEEQDSEILSSSGCSGSSLKSFTSNDENLKPLTDNQKRKKVGLSSKLKSKSKSESDQTSVDKDSSIRRSLTPRVLTTYTNKQ